MFKHLLLVAVATSMLAACATQPKPVALTARFNESQAESLTRPGVNIVSGSALIRQNGGGVVSCAGLPIDLVPQTSYATERVMAIYGNTSRGYNPAYRRVLFTPDTPSYQRLKRTTVCDAQGNFSFDDVADGAFYVVASITWKVGNQIQGGALMQAVSVSGGQSQQIVLSP